MPMPNPFCAPALLRDCDLASVLPGLSFPVCETGLLNWACWRGWQGATSKRGDLPHLLPPCTGGLVRSRCEPGGAARSPPAGSGLCGGVVLRKTPQRQARSDLAGPGAKEAAGWSRGGLSWAGGGCHGEQLAVPRGLWGCGVLSGLSFHPFVAGGGARRRRGGDSRAGSGVWPVLLARGEGTAGRARRGEARRGLGWAGLPAGLGRHRESHTGVVPSFLFRH